MKNILSFLVFLSISVAVVGQSITLDPKNSAAAGIVLDSDITFKNTRRAYNYSGLYSPLDRQNASVIIFEYGGTLTGIADGHDGALLFLMSGHPEAPLTLLIKNESATEVEANRIITNTGSDIELSKGGITLIYDGQRDRWRVLGTQYENWSTKGNYSTGTPNYLGTADPTPLVIKTANTERMRIANDGKIGIGTNDPKYQLHITKGSSGNMVHLGNTVATIESNGSTYLSILSPNNQFGGILFGSQSSPSSGSIVYEHPTNVMRFGINQNGMTLAATGLGIGTSNPDAKLHVSGDYIIENKVNINNTQTWNNLNREGCSIIKASGGGTVTLTGIAGGKDGMIVHIFVTSSTNLILAEDSSSSSSGNRIVTGSLANVTITDGGGATLYYDDDAKYWRVIGLKQ